MLRVSRQTADYLRVEALVKKLRGALPGHFQFGDVRFAQISQAAKDLRDSIDFHFEDERKEKIFKRVVKKKTSNFIKMLNDMAGLKSQDDWHDFRKKHETRSKDVGEKVYEYSSLLLDAISALDVEVDGSIKVGAYTVLLMQSPRGDWTDELIKDLVDLLSDSTRKVNSSGLGMVVGGKLLAYPAKKLPPPSGALAYYQPSKDLMAVAAEGNHNRVVQTLIHEMGHRYYFKVLSGGGRTAWKSFFGANVGMANVDAIISDWEKWADAEHEDYFDNKYARYMSSYGKHLKKTDPKQFMWLSMVAHAIDIDEPQNSSGYKKSTVSGLDQLIARKSQAKVFLYPITAYSGTEPAELFAEVFAYIVVKGPGVLEPIVREAFKQAVPQFRGASMTAMTDEQIVREIMKVARECVS